MNILAIVQERRSACGGYDSSPTSELLLFCGDSARAVTALAAQQASDMFDSGGRSSEME